MYCGDIAAAIGFKNVHDRRHAVLDRNTRSSLEAMHFPEPVIEVAIEPKTKADEEKMAIALQQAVRRGSDVPRAAPTRRSGQTIISGMGELHLEIIVDRMMREFNVQANVGKPQVAYRETITQEGRAADIVSSARPAARGQFADVTITLEPMPPGERLRVRERDQWAARSPRSTSPRWRRASIEAMENGIMAGYPVVDVKVDADRRPYHEVDSSEMAFKIAGSMAFKEAAARATPQLLEPIMDVEVVVPEEYMGDVIGDLSVAPRTHRRDVPARPTRAWSRRRCRCRRCSATRPGCARSRRAARSIRCSSRVTKTMPAAMAENIVAKVKGA